MPAWLEPNEYFLKGTADMAILIHLKLFILGILSFPLFSCPLVSHLIFTGYQACQYQMGTQVTSATCYKRAIHTLVYSHTVLAGFLKQSFMLFIIQIKHCSQLY